VLCERHKYPVDDVIKIIKYNKVEDNIALQT
jgi:hypothetical protein